MLRRFACLCVLLSGLCLTLTAFAEDSMEPERPGYTAHARAESGQLRRLSGSVVLEIRSALVGPTKDDGKPWDGLGWGRRQDVSERTQKPALFSQFVRLVKLGSSDAALAGLVPWAVGAASQATAAPDVQLEVYAALGQRPPMRILIAPKVQDKFAPSWVGVQTRPIPMREDLHISIRATDIDLEQHDAVGVCRIDGIPLADEHNYLSHESFECESQLLSLVIYAKTM